LAIVAISFFCVCGQNLRVDDNWAGGALRCIACGCLVRVPSATRTDQTVGPNSSPTTATTPVQVVPPVPVYELKVVEIAMPPSTPLTYRQPRSLDFAKAKRRPRSWQRETHWYEFLFYPLRALPRLFCLAMTWATVIAIVVAILPDDWTTLEFIARAPCILFIFLILGYTVACLDATFAAARAGDSGYIARPRNERLFQAVRAGSRAVFCFLAGPIVPAIVAVWFWLDNGDFEWVDWLICWELWILAIGYWTLALLALQARGRYRDASPAAIIKLVRRLGYRVLVAVLLISIIVIVHGFLMLGAVQEMHGGHGGWFVMLWCWVGLLFGVVLLLRWLGVTAFQAGKTKNAEMLPKETAIAQ
jgi:hypothetical protein